jgi:hypothetical protein
MKRYTKISLFMLPLLAIASFVVLSNWQYSLAGISNNSIPDQPRQISGREVAQTPRVRELSQEEKVDLATAQQRVKFRIKVPSNLPAGFTFQAAIVAPESNRNYTLNGNQFKVQSISMIFWNKSLTSKTTYEELKATGGIFLEIMYALGSNSTEPYRQGNYAKPNEITYLWGYPAVVLSDYIEVFRFDENLSYRLGGNHSQEVLMKIMESLIRG